MTYFAQHLQTVAGFLKLGKVTLVNSCPNAGKRILVGNRKRSQMKCGRTRV